jgi:hypothetical protein
MLILTAVCFLGAIYFFIRGFLASRSVPQRAYGVQQQDARHFMLVDFFRGGILLIVALVLLAIFGFSFFPQGNESNAPPLPVASATTEAKATLPKQAPSSPIAKTPELSPTSPIDTPTLVPTETPEPTDTPVVPTAVVVSPNGLWLREAPAGTQQLELIADGTVLRLLPDRETVEDLEWQLVRTPAGNEGWVAVEFLDYQ